eukprot:2856286-Prorocentrum_lima.AAC.1
MALLIIRQEAIDSKVLRNQEVVDAKQELAMAQSSLKLRDPEKYQVNNLVLPLKKFIIYCPYCDICGVVQS